MSGERLATTGREFVALAEREGFLPPDSAAELARQSAEQGVPPGQLALQRGLLAPVQIEIIETLLHPTSAIMGYEILGLIGYGGMGIVYRARQKSLGRIVALKTVLLGAQANVSRLSRFEHEAQTVGKLLHPHIVTAYDFGRDGGRLYFAMELVEGDDAERWIAREGPLTEPTTWRLIRQAASGLAHAAEFGVVHRDIKPANLLLVTPPKGFPLPPGTPMVKIADFGLALFTDDDNDRTRLTADNSAVGSPHYMAPEQLGRGEIDLRADIYALGATAYHMLAGRPPFDGLTLTQVFAQKLHSAPEPLASIRSDLSPETVSLIDEMMARDPNDRIDNYVELLDRIDQLMPAPRTTPDALTLASVKSAATNTRQIGRETKTSFGTFAEPLLSAHPEPVRHSLFDVAWRVVAAAVLVVGSVYVVSRWTQHPSAASVKPGVDLVFSGRAVSLFDGQSLAKWRTIAGNWQLSRDDEGAAVLAAGSGVISRNLGMELFEVTGERVDHFRLRFLVELREASAVELSFGIHTPNPDVEARSVLRIERNRGVLGRQTGETLNFVPVGPPVSWNLDPNRYHEVRVERQSSEWRAYVDDRLVGTVPLVPDETRKIRLAVTSPDEQKLAWFADFILEELVPPSRGIRLEPKKATT